MAALEKDVTPNDEEVHSAGSYISRTGPQKGEDLWMANCC